MQFQNPIVRGFYPDPSVCQANGKYYLICSTMHYFPGIPLFESEDLINWKQIGHCLTRESQINLNHVPSSGGVFAPTIRFYKGRFYVTTTNESLKKNFYVYTDDIYGDWSDPVFVEQGGIDPSLYFEDDRAYFMSNGEDDYGNAGITQCEIDITTGTKLSESKVIWTGSGGRYLEGPHVYKINDTYFLVAAEGGTEYGHMVTCAKSTSIHGPYIGNPKNPILTNRNLGGFFIQGIGHGDLIEAYDQSYYMLHLGFRQTGQWTTFHHLGREVFLTPVSFDEDGWFSAGDNGTTREFFEAPPLCEQEKYPSTYTFENTDFSLDWAYLRIPNHKNYRLSSNEVTLTGTKLDINDVDSPTFIGLRQKEFCGTLTFDVTLLDGEGGVTVMMDEKHHYDLALAKEGDKTYAFARLCIGTLTSVPTKVEVNPFEKSTLCIAFENQSYTFYYVQNETKTLLAVADTRYLSSEVCGGFTGVLFGLYATAKNISAPSNCVTFTNFVCEYKSFSEI